MIVFSVVPIAAPLTGALLTSAAGWRAIFWTYALVAAGLLAAVVAGLRETAPAQRNSMRPSAIAAGFAGMLTEPRFLAPLLVVLACQLAILAWVASSSFTLAGMGVSIDAYGAMFAGVMLGQIAGAWVASRLVMRLGMRGLVRAGSSLMLTGGAAAAAFAWAGSAHWAGIVAPFALLLFGAALVLPNATALALSPFPHAAGSASSLIGAIGFTAGALLSMLLGTLFDGTPRPMASAAALAAAGVFGFERWVRHGPR